MSTSRSLLTLTTGALGLFGVALLVSAGDLPAVRLPAIALPAVPVPKGSEWAYLLTGTAVGWTARWLYGLPWATLPRAFAGWLLGWGQRVTLLLTALAFVVVLLLY
jgi:hypothetical protein